MLASRWAIPPSLDAARQVLVGSGLRRTYRVAAAARAVRLTAPSTTSVLRPVVPPAPVVFSFRRRYSQPTSSGSSNSKIWSFEDVQKLTQEGSEPGVVIIDVREPGELKSTGHIPRAINIPVASAPDSFYISDEEFEDRFGYPRPSKESEVVFYCKAGVRSRAAAGLAREAGWTNVGEYPGSWMDWAAKGGPVERN